MVKLFASRHKNGGFNHYSVTIPKRVIIAAGIKEGDQLKIINITVGTGGLLLMKTTTTTEQPQQNNNNTTP